MEPTPEQARAIYRMMLFVRRFEERVAECFYPVGEVIAVIQAASGR